MQYFKQENSIDKAEYFGEGLFNAGGGQAYPEFAD